MAEQFNMSVSVGWQIDNFGHMQSMPYLLSNTGYESLILGRMAYRDLYDFASNSALQFLWQSERHPETAPLLTHFLSVHYASPSAKFDFDNRTECDTADLSEELRKFAMTQVRQYPGHGNILVMMGDDFRYVQAERAFRCMDKLIAHINNDQRSEWRSINAQYSTPSDYFAAVKPYLRNMDGRVSGSNSAERGLRLFKGDLYPYQDKPYEQYWSGMLTTRPYLKWLVRDTEQIVQHVEALVAGVRVRRFSGNTTDEDRWEELETHMEFARKQVAIGYHHDAITGTCTDSTFHDYAKRLKAAARVATLVGQYALSMSSDELAESGLGRTPLNVIQRMLKMMQLPQEELMPVGYNTAAQRDQELDSLGTPPRRRSLLVIPRHDCSAAKCDQQITVTNANSLAPQTLVVRLLVHTLDIALVDDVTGKPVTDLQVNRGDLAEALEHDSFVVEFVARDVPGFGLRSYTLTTVLKDGWAKISDMQGVEIEHSPREQRQQEAVLDKGGMQVHLSVTSDKRVRIATTYGGEKKVVLHGLRQYFANPKVQASGAYIMHSFMVMYALVFYIAGGSLCAGLAVSVFIHSDWLAGSQLGQLVPWVLRVPSLLAATGWQDKVEYSPVPESQGSEVGDRRSPTAVASPYPDGLYSERASSELLFIDETTAEPEPTERYPKTLGNAQTRRQPASQIRRAATGAVPSLLGGIVGLWFTHFAEQSANIDLLTRWTQGQGIVWLIVPGFAVGYVAAGTLRWTVRHSMLFIYGVSLATFLTMFFLPGWQSRNLPTEPLEFELQRGHVCDTARVQVNEHTSVAYKLCLDNLPLVQTTVTLTAESDREVVAQFELDQPSPPLADLLGCRFELYDGVDVVKRRYNRFTPIPGNYYPAISHVSLPGRITLHSRQPMGVTCPRANIIEAAMHRSMTGNDYRGMGVPLIDKTPAAITHFIDLWGKDNVITQNVRLNSPALAFRSPARTPLQQHALSAYSAINSHSLGVLRMVGVRASKEDMLGERGGSGNSSELHVYVRLQALPGALVNVSTQSLLNASDVFRVHGDWSMAANSTRHR
ncbi:mannosyl-oligosaccharide 1,3-1,6-alpha-mannosidase activity protein, partial [Linderina macrospora]